jgi:hypothetical protein
MGTLAAADADKVVSLVQSRRSFAPRVRSSWDRCEIGAAEKVGPLLPNCSCSQSSRLQLEEERHRVLRGTGEVLAQIPGFHHEYSRCLDLRRAGDGRPARQHFRLALGARRVGERYERDEDGDSAPPADA